MPPSPFVEHWNGTAWSLVKIAAVNGYFLGVSCFDAAECWATGTRVDSGGNTTVSLVERWNGSAWNVAKTAATGETYSELNSIACPGPSQCWGVGWAGPNQQNSNFLPIFPAQVGGKGVVERWNGSSWSIVASPQSAEGTDLSSVACTGPSDCWIVGSQTNTAGFARSALIEHWDGTTIALASVSSLSGSGGDFLRQVDCVNTSDCVAVGGSGLQAGLAQGMEPLAVGWNGSSWSGFATSRTTAFATMLDGVSCAGLSECFAGGFDINPSGQGIAIQGLLERLDLPQGYSLAGSDGGAFSFGSAGFAGSMSGRTLSRPVVAMATPDGDGYWLVGSDGGVFSFGDARYGGSEAGRHLSAPIVGAAAAGTGGYWLVGSDGGVFSLGGAGFHGSMAGQAPRLACRRDGGLRRRGLLAGGLRWRGLQLR